MLEALRDRDVEPRAEGPGEQASALLRAHVLGRVASALASGGKTALLVKGAALARTVYRDPAARPMSDIDLLVAERDLGAAISALTAIGGTVSRDAERAESASFFGETVVVLPAGGLTYGVELHTSLDKVIRRPVDLPSVVGRASRLADLPALSVPTPEDHALLVALHAAGHEFRHPIAWLDLELLFRRGLDFELLVQRARAWRLETVMFLALRALRELGAASITEAHASAFAPGRLRRAVLAHAVEVTSAPSEASVATGLGWLLRQAMFHDDLGAWARDVLRYAQARAADRSAIRSGRASPTSGP